MRFLMQSVPEARFTTGVTEDQIVAWARPKDHERIKELIDQVHGGAENARKVVVYELKNVTATAVATMLSRAIPDAVASQGTNPYQLVVWARPTEQARVQQIVDQLAVGDSPEKAFKAVTYTLDEITAASAMQILQLAVPQAQVSPGPEAYQLVAWARPEDHAIEDPRADRRGPGGQGVVYAEAGRSYYVRFLMQSVPDGSPPA